MKTGHPTTKMFFGIWLALLALLFLTWGVAQFDLGRWNLLAAMTIAVVKMLLVVLIFMHVRYSTRLTWLFVMAGFFWFFIMVTLTMGDYLTRAGLDFR
jgi:cytochrome c oxidase subunit IV